MLTRSICPTAKKPRSLQPSKPRTLPHWPTPRTWKTLQWPPSEVAEVVEVVDSEEAEVTEIAVTPTPIATPILKTREEEAGVVEGVKSPWGHAIPKHWKAHATFITSMARKPGHVQTDTTVQ